MTTADTAFAHLEQGPFPGLMDPWAENARYFQQLHSGMIGHLQVQLKRPLFDLGYIIGKETSLQIAEYRQPDLAIETFSGVAQQTPSWDYLAAATAIAAEPGLVTETALAESDLQALFIYDLPTGSLVTLIEIISPRNKIHWADMLDYQAWRQRMVWQGVNVVEIDLTRSVKRLLDNTLTQTTAYHVAIYLPQSPARIVPIAYHEALPRVALPLRGEVLPIMLQAAYDAAYRDGLIAGNILKDQAYALENLPFPSLLSFAQQQAAMTSVNQWYLKLQELRKIDA